MSPPPFGPGGDGASGSRKGGGSYAPSSVFSVGGRSNAGTFVSTGASQAPSSAFSVSGLLSEDPLLRDFFDPTKEVTLKRAPEGKPVQPKIDPLHPPPRPVPPLGHEEDDDDDEEEEGVPSKPSVPYFASIQSDRERLLVLKRIREKEEEEERKKKSGKDDTPLVDPDKRMVGFKNKNSTEWMRKNGLDEMGSVKKGEIGAKLPIRAHRDEILDTVDYNQVTIFSGDTGCGKSTQIPKYILLNEGKQRPVRILVTQPRRIAAISIADRVSQELGVPLGSVVGYKVGLDSRHSGADTKLLYVTTGVLKKKIIHRQSLDEFTHIILDEVHEREQDMDFVLLLCRELMMSCRKTKLILMSATIEVAKFRDYFSWPMPDTDEREYCGEFEITGHRPHHLITFYSDSPGISEMNSKLKDDDFVLDTAKLHPELITMAVHIIQNLDLLESHNEAATRAPNGPKHGTVLVFLPGEQEILRVKKVLDSESTCRRTTAKGKKGDVADWRVLMLHSRMPSEDAARIFDSPLACERKIILSTNIAESSLTIPDVEYVIDFCLTKLLRADPETQYVRLHLEWADRQSLKQRMGRAGRVTSGRVYRLVPHAFFRQLPECSEPELCRAPLDKVILDTKLLSAFGSPKQLLACAMDPPNIKNIRRTVLLLKQLGALLPSVGVRFSRDDGDLTALGSLMAALPVDVRLGKLVVLGHLLGVGDDAVVAAAGMSGKSIFATPMENKIEAYNSKLLWASGSFSDSIAVVNAYRAWQKQKRSGTFKGLLHERKWCQERFLQLKNLREMETSIRDLNFSLERSGLRDPEASSSSDADSGISSEQRERLLQCAIFGAFYPNYFVRNHMIDLRDASKAMNGRDLSNSVYLLDLPRHADECKELYEDDIRRLFHHCAAPDDIEVEFVRGKVIVQFRASPGTRIASSDWDNREWNLPGEIVHPVYVALKLAREHEMNRSKSRLLSLEIFQNEEASAAMDALRKALDEEEKGIVESTPREDFQRVGWVDPPGVEEEVRRLSIVHVDSPGNFWAHYIPETEEAMDEIRQITSAINENETVHPKDARVNSVYLAPYAEDGCIYRAVVERFTDDKKTAVSLHYIDYGNRGECDVRQLIKIDGFEGAERLLELPGQALQCTLAGTQPNPLVSSAGPGQWCKEAKKWFEKHFFLRPMIAEIISVTPHVDSPLVSVILRDPVAAEFSSKSVNNQIKKFKVSDSDGNSLPVAVDAPPSYLASENYARRVHSATLHASLRDEYNREQRRYTGDGVATSMTRNAAVMKRLDKALLAKKNLEIKLKGPEHPLRFTIACPHRLGLTKEIRVGAESVNSVLLDRFPTDAHDQWMTAASVTLSGEGGGSSKQAVLLARDTTAMPNVHGMGALLTMVFAPSVEMRVAKDNASYSGFLCGLGTRPKDWGRGLASGKFHPPPKPPKKTSSSTTLPPQTDRVSLNPQHDMEVIFDVRVDASDVAAVNRIRESLCTALARTRHESKAALAESQTAIRKDLLSLLYEERDSVPKQHPDSEHAWDALPRELLAPLPLRMRKDDAGHFLKQIRQVRLECGETARARRLGRKGRRLRKLERLALGVSVSGELQCPVCERAPGFKGQEDAAVHLAEERHGKAKEAFEEECRRERVVLGW